MTHDVLAVLHDGPPGYDIKEIRRRVALKTGSKPTSDDVSSALKNLKNQGYVKGHKQTPFGHNYYFVYWRVRARQQQNMLAPLAPIPQEGSA